MALVASCGAASSNTVQMYPVYQFTCCAREDVEQTWHPGQTVELHWMVRQGAPSVSNTPHPVTLYATIMGPYADLGKLKQGGTAAYVIQGSTVRTNDRTPSPVPVSTFVLGSNLPPGYYNLMFVDDLGNGRSAPGAFPIRIGAA